MPWMGALEAGKPWSLKVVARLSNRGTTAILITWVGSDGSLRADSDSLAEGMTHETRGKLAHAKRVYIWVDLPEKGGAELSVEQEGMTWAKALRGDTQWVFDIL
jgi:hypothetical protein